MLDVRPAFLITDADVLSRGLNSTEYELIRKQIIERLYEPTLKYDNGPRRLFIVVQDMHAGTAAMHTFDLAGAITSYKTGAKVNVHRFLAFGDLLSPYTTSFNQKDPTSTVEITLLDQDYLEGRDANMLRTVLEGHLKLRTEDRQYEGDLQSVLRQRNLMPLVWNGTTIDYDAIHHLGMRSNGEIFASEVFPIPGMRR